MSWQDDFQQAVADSVFKYGYVEQGDEVNRYYGSWWDYEETQHARECELGSWSDIRETTWQSFVSTFDDAQIAYAITMTFSCKCGKLTDRTISWEARFGDVLRKLVGLEAES